MFVVNKSSVGPQLPGDFLSRQQLTGPLQQQAQHLKRLCVQLDPESISAKLSRGYVCFKCAEAIAPCWLCIRHAHASVTDHALNPVPLPNVQLFASLISAITCTVRNLSSTSEIPCIASPAGSTIRSVHDATPAIRPENTFR